MSWRNDENLAVVTSACNLSLSSFRRRPESSNRNIPRSGQNLDVGPHTREIFNRLDTGLRRYDGATVYVPDQSLPFVLSFTRNNSMG
jgi:hypothetical protein